MNGLVLSFMYSTLSIDVLITRRLGERPGCRGQILWSGLVAFLPSSLSPVCLLTFLISQFLPLPKANETSIISFPCMWWYTGNFEAHIKNIPRITSDPAFGRGYSKSRPTISGLNPSMTQYRLIRGGSTNISEINEPVQMDVECACMKQAGYGVICSDGSGYECQIPHLVCDTGPLSLHGTRGSFVALFG